MARTSPPGPKRSLGLTLLLVDSKSPGIRIQPIKKLVHKAADNSEVFLFDVVVPAENVLGEAGQGFYHLLGPFNNQRISLAAIALGVAQAALGNSRQYALERRAFGWPIGQLQTIQHYIARMLVQIEQAQLLTYKAAWLQSPGQLRWP